MRSRLFVGNLSYDATEADLTEIFSGVGQVISVSIRTDRETGKPRGFAFVQMSSSEEAASAVTKLNGTAVHGRNMRVSEAEQGRTTAPPKSGDAAPDSGAPASATVNAQPPQSSSMPGPSDRRTEASAAAPAERRRDGDLSGPAPAASPAWSRPVTLTAGLLVLAIIVGVWALGQDAPAPAVDEATLFIAPFRAEAATAGGDYLGYALAQAIAMTLAPAQNVHVLPVLDGNEVRGMTSQERAAVARDLGAGRILEGTVARQGDSVLLSLTLIDTARNRVQWGSQAQGADREVLKLASGLALQLGQQLGASFPTQYPYVLDLIGSPAMMASPLSEDTVAALKRGDMKSAMTLTDRLQEAFPEMASLCLRLHALILQWDAEHSSENLARVKSTLKRLEAIDEKAPYAPIYSAYLRFRTVGPAEGIADFTAVLGRTDLVAPARAWVLRYRAIAHQYDGDSEGALTDLNESLRLDPTNAWTLGILSGALEKEGRFEDALRRAEQGVALLPGFWRTQHTLANALAQLKRWSQAATAYQRACELGRSQTPCSLVALAQWKADDRNAAARSAASAAELTPSVWGTYNLGCYWSLKGDGTRAMSWLERSRELGLPHETADDDQDLAGLAKDPRFVAWKAQLRKTAP